MSELPEWVDGVEGNFPIHQAVVAVMHHGTKVISAETSGISAWTKTAKVTANLPSGERKRYFLKVNRSPTLVDFLNIDEDPFATKCATGRGARALSEGEFYSASLIDAEVPDLVPTPTGWGGYKNGETQIYFYLGDFHDMDFTVPPEPEDIMASIAKLHAQGTSSNGMFGFPVPTVCGILERTVTWEPSWADSFTHQLKDVIQYDNDTNGPWPEFDVACKRLIDAVIPRLLGALQSDGRKIRPSLIHGDLWKRNVGIDMETGDIVVFDPGSVYAHNEMEFGTWRCSWAFYFNSPTYMQAYQRHIEPSEPVDEWDDRNRLYSMHPYLNDSAGHPGSGSRAITYNDMLYLIEKYAPLEGLEKYDPGKDISVTGAYTPFVMKQLE